MVNNQKIAWGVKIANFRIGGYNIVTSQKILENRWNDFAGQKIIFLYQENSRSINLADLGFQINCQATINQAYQIGRKSNIFVNLKEQLSALIGCYNLEPIYTIDQEKFQKQTAELFKNIERPAQNASLVFNEKVDDFLLQLSTKGIAIDRKQLLTDLSERIKTFSAQSINLELTYDYPIVENDEVDSARQKAQQILANQPYYLTFEGESYRIDKAILIGWIIFEPIKEQNSDNLILGFNLDNQKVKKYLSKIAAGIDQPVTNAQLETQDNRATLFIPDHPGFEVKEDLTFNQLVENLLADPPIKKTYIIADRALPKLN
jgi:vancomycin resistance protein YoaR